MNVFTFLYINKEQIYFTLWADNWPLSGNFLSHWVHWHGFSPECTLKWVFSSPLVRNFLLHSPHSKFFWAEWVSIWLAKTCFSINIRSHTGHWKDRDRFVCNLRLCAYKLLIWRKDLAHKSHLYGFSSVWFNLCVLRWSERRNFWPQSRHSNFFGKCTFLWLFKLPRVLKVFEQI